MTFTVLSFTYLLIWKLMIRQFLIPSHWPDGADKDQICIYLTSIVHSTTLCPPLLVLLLTQPFRPSAPMNGAPKWWQSSANALLEFCTGYMLYDGLHNGLFLNYLKFGFELPTDEWCFLGHHLATSYYMTSTRINGAGHLSAMIIMFFGEITNPAQNSRSAIQVMLKMGDCCSTPYLKHTLYPIVDFIYALMYAIVRVGLNPYLNVRITYDFLFTTQGRKLMPIALSLSLLFMLWGVSLGTIPWCLESVDLVKTIIGKGIFHSSSINIGDQDL